MEIRQIHILTRQELRRFVAGGKAGVKEWYVRFVVGGTDYNSRSDFFVVGVVDAFRKR